MDKNINYNHAPQVNTTRSTTIELELVKDTEYPVYTSIWRPLAHNCVLMVLLRQIYPCVNFTLRWALWWWTGVCHPIHLGRVILCTLTWVALLLVGCPPPLPRLDWPPSCLTFVPSLSDRVFSFFFFFLFWCCPTAGFPSSTRSPSLVPHLCALTFRYEFLLLKFCVCCDFC